MMKGKGERERRRPENVLESVHMQALLRQDKKGMVQPSPHDIPGGRVTDEMIGRRMKEMSVEDAREMAFQAKEQMRTLNEVTSRVKNAMSKAKDLDLDLEDKNDKNSRPADSKRWLDDSRRYINGAIFRYNESCIERNEALNGFCNWFELYENIWPLPLVSSDVQYDVLLGGEAKQQSEEDEGFENLQDLWPQMTKMRDDLGQIMSATSEMGQKALNAELRAELKRLSNEILDKQSKLELSEKKIKAEKDLVKMKENELSKLRQMNEVQVKRRDEDIKSLKEELAANKLQHEQLIERMKEDNARKVAKVQAELEAFKIEAEKEAAYLRKTISKCKETITSLEAAIEEWKAKVAARDKQIETLQSELSTLHDEIEVIKVQLSQVTAELAAERESPYISKLQKINADLEQQVEQLTEALDEAKETIQTRDGQIMALKKAIEDGKAREAENKIKIQAQTEELALKKAQVELLTAKVAELEDKLKTTSEELAARLEDITNMEDVFAKEREKLHEDIKFHRKRADELDALLKKSREDSKRYEDELKEARAELEEAEIRRQEEAKVAAETIAGIKAERDAARAELQEKMEEFRSRLAGVEREHTDAIASMDAQIAELVAFKEEVESHVFEDRPAQTESSVFTSGGDDAGTGGTGEGFPGGEMMRRKFAALKERVLDVRGTFDRELHEFKRQLLSAVKLRASWQKALDTNAGGLAVQLSEAMQAYKLKGGAPEEVGALVRLFAAAEEVVASCSAMTNPCSGEGNSEVVHRIPKTLSEIERILEGIESFFDAQASSRPSSADSRDSDRPSSASVRKLRPLVAKASSFAELHMAEGLNDFSKYNTLVPMESKADEEARSSEAEAQAFFSEQGRGMEPGRGSYMEQGRVKSPPDFPRRPASSKEWSNREGSGAVTPERLRTPERSRPFSPDAFTPSPNARRGINPFSSAEHSRGIFFGISTKVSDASYSYRSDSLSHSESTLSPVLKRSMGDTTLSMAPTPTPNPYSPAPNLAHQKSLTARSGTQEYSVPERLTSLTARSATPDRPMVAPRIRRGSPPKREVHDLRRAPSSEWSPSASKTLPKLDRLTPWQQYTHDLPPEIEPPSGVLWAASGAGGVTWSSEKPVPGEKQRWVSSGSTKGKLAEERHSSQDVSRERMTGAQVAVSARPMSATHEVPTGSFGGLRPAKVFRSRPHTDRPSTRTPASESTRPLELLHPVLERPVGVAQSFRP
mmetsp:Transcript_64614/g.159054  ORF Transcript_64614/g.159054 Transcript_64614/m.159054 type:complete len:1220 (+) Transcript_64614:60-3719(+)